MKEISLSSWYYDSFSFSKTNPYYCSENNKPIKSNNIKENYNNDIKMVKQEYFDNLPYEKYINRESYLKDEFINKLNQKRINELAMIKKWKNI